MLDHSVGREEIEQARRDSLKRYFHTTFQHHDVHHGIRKGVYSVIMGTPSCGKSGLSKAIAVQAASTSPDTKVLMILSEESKADYAGAMLAYADKTGTSIDHITFYEESKMDHQKLKTHEQYLSALKDVIAGSFANLVIIDNITTSRLYGPSTAMYDQGKSVWFMKNLAKDLDIAILAIAHTRTEVSDNMNRLFTTQDHRGVKALGAEAAYFYALQKFTSNNNVFVFCSNLKHRFHPNASGHFLMKYDMDLGVYVGDQKVPFDKMKEIFQIRDNLGK